MSEEIASHSRDFSGILTIVFTILGGFAAVATIAKKHLISIVVFLGVVTVVSSLITASAYCFGVEGAFVYPPGTTPMSLEAAVILLGIGISKITIAILLQVYERESIGRFKQNEQRFMALLEALSVNDPGLKDRVLTRLGRLTMWEESNPSNLPKREK